MKKPATKPESKATASELAGAARHLKNGGLVAIPTETVYGLAADIYSKKGLEAIFRVKQRPTFDPLIVHIADFAQIDELASDWSQIAERLAREFWPGPLTIVVPKSVNVDPLITAGLETVGIRMPQHQVTLDLIRLAQTPIAAPSANRFGRTSPTKSEHVRGEFPEAIASGEVQILEGGESSVGVESTVCMVEGDSVIILRPGGITAEEIESRLKVTIAIPSSSVDPRRSPGHTEHHYETKKPLIVSWGEAFDPNRRYRVRNLELKNVIEIKLPSDASLAARILYSALREGDQAEGDGLFIRRDHSDVNQTHGLWRAIDDRLSRAARLQLGRSAH